MTHGFDKKSLYETWKRRVKASVFSSSLVLSLCCKNSYEGDSNEKSKIARQ
ncbi:hypothetical protein SAMN05216404_111104 [Nitrosospira multiformis]|uniref:Uncharacterized protein n=1 Tax=Nitrosospira multiformis TaxID=1231 RepID=A0A1H8LZW0_9PROT|nr:hypothetical protein SAMN05216404_111104 [Nitrosospira multiformis]